MDNYYKNNALIFLILSAIIIFVFVFFQVKPSDIKNNPDTVKENAETKTQQTEWQQFTEKIKKNRIVNIKINPMMNFSGMSADEILSLRKKAVNNSVLFSSLKDYEPNPDVFQIEGGAQWISAHEISCNGVGKPTIGNGDSRESVGILNPELMFYLQILNLELSKRHIRCGKEDYLIPYKVTYSPKLNEITVYIDYFSFSSKTNFYYVSLHNANAHDLGYGFAYAENHENIKFLNEPNFSDIIAETYGFYHRGFSCEHPDGCNNYSPYQAEYDFNITKLPASLSIKLWKERPSSPEQPADLNYKMIFK